LDDDPFRFLLFDDIHDILKHQGLEVQSTEMSKSVSDRFWIIVGDDRLVAMLPARPTRSGLSSNQIQFPALYG
jgi:hypothetical protein